MDLIKTKRLLVKPLNYRQLVKYLQNDQSLENELRLEKEKRFIPGALKEALALTIIPAVRESGDQYLFSTLWTVILVAENKMVADICLLGNANASGEIEIGYGTYDGYRGKGIMSEAVGGMVEWLKKQPGVNTIIATTGPDNLASYNVLLKNGFIKNEESGGMVLWKHHKQAS